jgi:hypothetical protein
MTAVIRRGEIPQSVIACRTQVCYRFGSRRGGGTDSVILDPHESTRDVHRSPDFEQINFHTC